MSKLKLMNSRFLREEDTAIIERVQKALNEAGLIPMDDEEAAKILALRASISACVEWDRVTKEAA